MSEAIIQSDKNSIWKQAANWATRHYKFSHIMGALALEGVAYTLRDTPSAFWFCAFAGVGVYMTAPLGKYYKFILPPLTGAAVMYFFSQTSSVMNLFGPEFQAIRSVNFGVIDFIHSCPALGESRSLTLPANGQAKLTISRINTVTTTILSETDALNKLQENPTLEKNQSSTYTIDVDEKLPSRDYWTGRPKFVHMQTIYMPNDQVTCSLK